MSYTAPKGVMFVASPPCGECLGCKIRARIARDVNEIIATSEPEIESTRDAWVRATTDVTSEEWRAELNALIEARDWRLARAIAPSNAQTIPPCDSLRLTPRISFDCNDEVDS